MADTTEAEEGETTTFEVIIKQEGDPLPPAPDAQTLMEVLEHGGVRLTFEGVVSVEVKEQQ